MPDSPHARSETRANAPKPSQQSKANRSNGTKTRHMRFFSRHKMGRVGTNAALWSTGDPVSWGVKTPTNAQLPEAGRVGYSKEAKNVPLDGQASCLSSGDACCLRDGAYASRLAT